MEKLENEFTTVPKVVILFSYTNGSHEGFVDFYVIEVFKFLGKDLMDFGIKEWQEPKLGDAQGTPR